MTEERQSARERVSGGIKQGIGVLSALKDALEETIAEARERGDLSPERAKEALRHTLARAQEAAEGARERLDFVRQKDFEGLSEVVDGIRTRVDALEERVRAWTGGEAASDPAPPEGDAGSPDAPEGDGGGAG